MCVGWIYTLRVGFILDIHHLHWMDPAGTPIHLVCPGPVPYTLGVRWMHTLYAASILGICTPWISTFHNGYILDVYSVDWVYVGYILYVLGLSWIYTLYTGYILQAPLYIWYTLVLYAIRWAYLACIPYTLGLSWIYVHPVYVLYARALSWMYILYQKIVHCNKQQRL